MTDSVDYKLGFRRTGESVPKGYLLPENVVA